METFKEKYGGHPMQNEDIKNKIKKYNQKNFGVDYVMQNPEIAKKCGESRSYNSKTIGYGLAICEECGKEYIRGSTNQKYCSHKCALKVLYKARYTGACIDCGKPILEGSTRCYHCRAIYDFENNEEIRNRIYGKWGSGSKTKINEVRGEFLEEAIGIPVEYEFSYGGYRYDIKIGNFLIEIDPTWTHNSTINYFGKSPMKKLYHQKKSLAAEKGGYHCIHLFEWDDNDRVKNWLIGLIGKRKRLYHGDIRKINPKEAEAFYDANHLQGRCQATVHYGLFIKGELINAMSFTNTEGEWTLVRFASKQGYRVAHGAEKLFNTFIKEYNPSYVISFSDITKHSGGLYNALGFKIDAINSPSYWRVGNGEVYWRRDCQKKNMHRLKGFDQNYKYLEHQDDLYWQQTERELMESHGYVKVCDAGMRRHLRVNQKTS